MLDKHKKNLTNTIKINKDFGMTEGTIKTSRYEIIVIFRRNQVETLEIEVFFNNKNIMTQLYPGRALLSSISSPRAKSQGINTNSFCIVIQERLSSVYR